jgi:nucleotide-binding universal stress UspA family protein
MKTIAVLTDFSERSTNAALYALQLARHLRANILLHHTFLVPADTPLSAEIAWPLEEYNEIKDGSVQELRKQADELKKILNGLATDAFRPDIACTCAEGAFTVKLDSLLADKTLILLVMANHHKGLSALMTGNHLRGTLDIVSLPVLVVPEHAVFKTIQKIAFPTDLGIGDLNVLGSLAGLARPFHAEILLAHIRPEEGDMEAPVKDFLQDVGNQIDYPNIYYRNVNQKRVKAGLQELEKQVGADLLVMVHRNKGFAEQLFGGSHTQKIAADPLLPLLIYPYPAHSYPVF